MSPYGVITGKLLEMIRAHLSRHVVMLFLQPPGRRTRRLSVLLLPVNVVIREVMAMYKNNQYIESRPILLNPKQHYSLQCRPTSHKVQPQTATDLFSYEPNFLPTFEVDLDLTAEEVSLQLLGPDNALVWEKNIHLTLTGGRYAGSSQPTRKIKLPIEKTMLSVRTEFIKRVSEPVLYGLVDKLLEEKVLNDEEVNSIRAEKNRKEKARHLIDRVRNKGNEASLKMITALHQLDLTLHHHLGLEEGDQCAGPSQPTMMTTSQEAEMLLSKQKEFINQVSESVLDGLLDNLLDEKVLNDEEVNSIRAEKYKEEKAQQLIDMVTRKGKEASLKMTTALHQLDPTLHHHLGLEKEYLPGASSSQPNMPMTLLQQMEMLRTVMDERPTEPVLKLLLDNLLKVLKDEKMTPTRREKYLEQRAQEFITTLQQQDPKLYQQLGLADMRLSDEVDPSNMDITPFPPIVHKEHTTNEYRFRFLRPGLFQCTVTGLVFGTTGEGDVLYKIVRWKRWLQSTGMTPAGPLFDIECPQQSVCQLYLPHCDVTPEEDLSVAHISNEEVNFLEPLKVTETHVVVNVTHLCFLGLVRSCFKCDPKPIKGQVLLFLRPPRRYRHEMSVFLLPRNVPPEEVKFEYEHCEYIETPRRCRLTPDDDYSVHCPEAHIVQPKECPFELDFDQKHDPLFEVFMDLNPKYFSLEVRGPDKEKVWQRDKLEVKAADTDTERGAAAAPSSSPHDVRQAHSRGAAAVSRAGKTRGPSEQDADDDLTDREKARFVIDYKADLIQMVPTVKAIVDSLGDKVHREIYAEIYKKEINMDRMRVLYMYVLEPGGTSIKAAFYNALKKHQPHLLELLEKVSASSVPSEEQFRCPICLNVFTDPITTPCEHSFCKACITKSWDTSGVCKCPLCRKSYRRSKLSDNRSLAKKADEFKISQQLKETSITEAD